MLKYASKYLGWLKSLVVVAALALPWAGEAFAQDATGTARGDRQAAIELVTIPAGRFTMGSYDRYDNEQPAHTVIVGSFQISRTEITQLTYQAVIGRNPSVFRQGNLPMLHPVENVCWYDAILFCNLASQQEGLQPVYFADAEATMVWAGQVREVFWKRDANGYRLPTEAEWEYAARGGQKTDITLPASGIADEVAWYSGNSGTQDDKDLSPDWVSANQGWTHRVGLKAANGYGLYDMNGNVREWCWDWFGRYINKTQTDPIGPAYGPSRVLRGGGFASDPEDITVSVRSQGQPGVRSPIFGFRVARNAPAASPSTAASPAPAASPVSTPAASPAAPAAAASPSPATSPVATASPAAVPSPAPSPSPAASQPPAATTQPAPSKSPTATPSPSKSPVPAKSPAASKSPAATPAPGKSPTPSKSPAPTKK